jgi:hypothetical protein
MNKYKIFVLVFKWAERIKADGARAVSASRLNWLITLYTNCLKLIGSRGHVNILV